MHECPCVRQHDGTNSKNTLRTQQPNPPTHTVDLRKAPPSTISRSFRSNSKLPTHAGNPGEAVVVAEANLRAAFATELAVVEPANPRGAVGMEAAVEEATKP